MAIGWSGPGAQAPPNQWNFDMGSRKLVPPGVKAPINGIQATFPMGWQPGAGQAGFGVLHTPPGTPAPRDMLNFTPSLNQVDDEGMLAPIDAENYSLIPQRKMVGQGQAERVGYGQSESNGTGADAVDAALSALDDTPAPAAAAPAQATATSGDAPAQGVPVGTMVTLPDGTEKPYSADDEYGVGTIMTVAGVKYALAPTGKWVPTKTPPPPSASAQLAEKKYEDRGFHREEHGIWVANNTGLPLPDATQRELNAHIPRNTKVATPDHVEVAATSAAVKAGADPAGLKAARERLGMQGYLNLCEQFVENVNGTTGQYPSAAAAYAAYAANRSAHSGLDGVKPGDKVYFSDPNQPYGHTGIYSGDGKFISPINGRVIEQPIDDWLKQSGQSVLGYVPGQNADETSSDATAAIGDSSDGGSGLTASTTGSIQGPTPQLVQYTDANGKTYSHWVLPDKLVHGHQAKGDYVYNPDNPSAGIQTVPGTADPAALQRLSPDESLFRVPAEGPPEDITPNPVHKASLGDIAQGAQRLTQVANANPYWQALNKGLGIQPEPKPVGQGQSETAAPATGGASDPAQQIIDLYLSQGLRGPIDPYGQINLGQRQPPQLTGPTKKPPVAPVGTGSIYQPQASPAPMIGSPQTPVSGDVMTPDYRDSRAQPTPGIPDYPDSRAQPSPPPPDYTDSRAQPTTGWPTGTTAQVNMVPQAQASPQADPYSYESLFSSTGPQSQGSGGLNVFPPTQTDTGPIGGGMTTGGGGWQMPSISMAGPVAVDMPFGAAGAAGGGGTGGFGMPGGGGSPPSFDPGMSAGDLGLTTGGGNDAGFGAVDLGLNTDTINVSSGDTSSSDYRDSRPQPTPPPDSSDSFSYSSSDSPDVSTGFGQSDGMAPPVPPQDAEGIGSRFGEVSPIDQKPHLGTDVQAAKGTPVLARAEGTVVKVETRPMLGLTVIVKDKQGVDHTYGHLLAAMVKPGDAVKAGQSIAQVGESGTGATGPNLHYAMEKNGQPLNPEPSMGPMGQMPMSPNTVGMGQSAPPPMAGMGGPAPSPMPAPPKPGFGLMAKPSMPQASPMPPNGLEHKPDPGQMSQELLQVLLKFYGVNASSVQPPAPTAQGAAPNPGFGAKPPGIGQAEDVGYGQSTEWNGGLPGQIWNGTSWETPSVPSAASMAPPAGSNLGGFTGDPSGVVNSGMVGLTPNQMNAFNAMMQEYYNTQYLGAQLAQQEQQLTQQYQIALQNATTQQAQQQAQSAYQQGLLGLQQQAQQAGLTGQLNGQQTFPAQLQQAGLTGQFNGQQTLPAQLQQANIAAQQAGLTGMFQGSPTEQAKEFQQNIYQQQLNSALSNPWLQSLTGMAPGMGQPGYAGTAGNPQVGAFARANRTDPATVQAFMSQTGRMPSTPDEFYTWVRNTNGGQMNLGGSGLNVSTNNVDTFASQNKTDPSQVAGFASQTGRMPTTPDEYYTWVREGSKAGLGNQAPTGGMMQSAGGAGGGGGFGMTSGPTQNVGAGQSEGATTGYPTAKAPTPTTGVRFSRDGATGGIDTPSGLGYQGYGAFNGGGTNNFQAPNMSGQQFMNADPFSLSAYLTQQMAPTANNIYGTQMPVVLNNLRNWLGQQGITQAAPITQMTAAANPRQALAATDIGQVFGLSPQEYLTQQQRQWSTASPGAASLGWA